VEATFCCILVWRTQRTPRPRPTKQPLQLR